MQVARISAPAVHLFMRPRALSHRLREQTVIAKAIVHNLFESVEVFECGRFH